MKCYKFPHISILSVSFYVDCTSWVDGVACNNVRIPYRDTDNDFYYHEVLFTNKMRQLDGNGEEDCGVSDGSNGKRAGFKEIYSNQSSAIRKNGMETGWLYSE